MTKLSFRRSIWSYHKVQLARSRLTRNRRAFMNLKQSGLYLDIGCGTNMRPQNINVDYHWRPGVDACCDITRPLPFPDNYAAGIYSEHCLEHIPFRSALAAINEFHRVVRPGSAVRIVVPDLEIYIDRYDTFRTTGKTTMPYEAGDPIDGLYSPCMSINRIMHEHGHQFIYDFHTLAKMLALAGFDDIKKKQIGESDDPKLLLDTPGREVESLYVEAHKPN